MGERRCNTCSRTRLPLVTTPSDGLTHCYPCMALDGHPLVGPHYMVPPEVVMPWKGWSVSDGAVVAEGIEWKQVKALVSAGWPRASIRAPGEL